MKIEVLMSHIRKGNLEALTTDLSIFINVFKRSIDDTDMFDKTLLMEASLLGKIDMMTFLLEQGAKVEVSDTRSKTPLMCAALSGNTKAVELLLKNGANIDMHNEDGETALSCAAINSDIAMMRYLLEKKADINVQDVWGTTLLKEAYTENNMDMVHFLIQQGIDVDAELEADVEGEDGKTLLVQFLKEGNYINALSLMEYNAKFEPVFKWFVDLPVREYIVLYLAQEAERMIPDHVEYNKNMKQRAYATGVELKIQAPLICHLYSTVRDYLYRDEELIESFNEGVLSKQTPVKTIVNAFKIKRDPEPDQERASKKLKL